MAQVKTYDVVGIKEDVSDFISNITPTKTPFQTMLGAETCTQPLYEWQEDSLRAVQTHSVLEGADAAEGTRSATVMRDNVTQIFQDTLNVSGTMDATSTYGRKKETAYQLFKIGKELKRDVEHAMVGIAQAKVAGASATARKFASALNQISSSTTTEADPVGSTPAALTETMLLNLGQKVYNEGADPSVFMIKPSDALIVADFAKATGRNRDFGGDKKVVNVVDLYVSPFGEYRVVLNRFLKTDHALLLDPDMWAQVTLQGRGWSRTPLAKTGDSQKHQVLAEISLKHKNQKASGKITELT